MAELVVTVEANLRRQVHGNRKPGLPGLQQIFITRVGFFGRGKTGVGTHGPQASAVHCRLHAACKRILPGKTKFFAIIKIFYIKRRIQTLRFKIFAFRKFCRSFGNLRFIFV